MRGRSLLSRAGRAARLDAAVYREARHDPRATAQAAAVVMTVAAAHGAADVVRALLVGGEIDARWQTAWIFGVTGELVYWGVSTLLVAAFARLLFRKTISTTVLVRVLGLAAAPGMLIVVAAALSAVLPPPAVLLPILTIRLIAVVLAIRAGTCLGWLPSTVLLLLSAVGGVAAVVAATTILYA